MIHKIYLISLSIILSVSSSISQENPFDNTIPKTPDGLHRCYSEQMQYELYESNSEFRKFFENGQLEPLGSNQKSGFSQNQFSDSVIRIPVVVHVLHNNGPENISTAQIESQIRILNEDFRRIPGTNGFGPGVDTKIEFFLARKDEQGDCTDGIVRVQSSATNNGTDSQIKNASPNWDPTKYLNIYVINTLGGVLGYAFLPNIINTNPNIDGVVIVDNFFGDTGTSGSGSFGLGRTTTHEVGHWLGLRHTFQGGCSGMNDGNCFSNAISPGNAGDGVCDTPPVSSANFGCASSRNSCSENITVLGGNAPDQVQNYMDYSDDFCFDRFTLGQKDRMMHMLNTFRPLFLDSNNAINAGYYGCELLAEISSVGSACVNDQVNITFNLEGNPPFDVVYTDGINNFNINGVFSPYNEIVTASLGTSNYTIVSVSDQDSTKTAPDPSLSGTATITATFPGISNATLSGMDSLCQGDTSIINFSATGGTGPFDIEINNGVGLISGVINNSDILVTPPDTSTYELISISDANGCVTTNFTSTAKFSVIQSPNTFFLKSINQGIVTFTNSTVGASNYQWNFGDGNLSSQENPVHAYANTGQYNVSLTAFNTLGCSKSYSESITISEVSAFRNLKFGEEINVFPNPTNEILKLNIKLSSKQDIKILLIDLNGKELMAENSLSKSDHSIVLNVENIPSGLYFLSLEFQDGRVLNSRVFKQ